MDRGCTRITIFLLAVILVQQITAEEFYSSKYDNVNVDEILSNSRMRNQYLDCYLGIAPCITPVAKFFKDTFPEALVTKCRKCTEKQKDFFEKITIWYTENDPKTWDHVIRKTIQDVQKKN